MLLRPKKLVWSRYSPAIMLNHPVSPLGDLLSWVKIWVSIHIDIYDMEVLNGDTGVILESGLMQTGIA